jgi:hypothetical protein
MAFLVSSLDLGDGSTVVDAYVRAQVVHEIRDPNVMGGQRMIEYVAYRRVQDTETTAGGVVVPREYWRAVGSIRRLFPVNPDAPLHGQLYADLATDPAFADAEEV